MQSYAKLKIAIIGAGFTGLTAAYELVKAGHKVTVFEKNSYAGGLAAGIKGALVPMVRQRRIISGWDLECFQHHFFTNDTKAFKLIEELGFANKLLKLSPKTSILYQDKIYRFDTPLSLLTFPHLSFFEKAKFGSAIACLKLTNNWKKLEGETADSWWKKRIGEKSYQMLWEPLLKGKFGDYYKGINMAWFWARIKKRTQKLYYLEGSLQILVDKLVEEIENKEGRIRLNQKVDSVVAHPCLRRQAWRANDTNKRQPKPAHRSPQGRGGGLQLQISDGFFEGPFDRVIITTSPRTLLQFLPNLPADYKEKIKKLRGIGAQALILFLNKPFLTDGTYWLNINDPFYPFLSVVEHTNFIDPKYYDGNHIVYIGNYLPAEHPHMQMNKEELLEEFTPYLKRINLQFSNSLIPACAGRSNSLLYREGFAQPLTPINHSQNIPPLQTPIENIYLASMSQVYPWDRGVNYAIALGCRVAQEI